MLTAFERAPELPKYELLERIGVGGMATVYRARDRRLGRDVAVKLIHAHLRENPEVAARFVSEARAVARLRHPNIVEVFDISDENEPERYLVAELVSGMTLRTLLSKHRSVPAEVAVCIGLEVASALSHAHSQGIIHRDVKPENVLIDLSAANSGPASPSTTPPRPKIKLTDFGIAKLLDAQGVTSTGQVLGSPAHMAPEQIEGGEVGPRADVFALAVMLYECMVGRLPFDGKNPAQVLRRVLDGTYPPADREQPVVGARWAAILAHALEKSASDRYESIEAFSIAMRAELELVGIRDTRAEVEKFLGDQEGYVAAFPSRIVEALVQAGEKARQERDFLLASAEFNRALALKPGDSDLVRRVSAVARRTRLVAIARAAFLVGCVSSLAAGAVVALRHRIALHSAERSAPRDPSNGSKAALAPPKGAPTVASAAPGADPAPAPRRAPVVVYEPTHFRKPAVPEATTREVKVDVSGPKGGYVMVDGIRHDEWFSKPIELSVGPHRFEWVPSQTDICLPSPPLLHVVEAGDGKDYVLLSVTYRDARLHADGPPGTLTCGRFFAGTMTVPATRSVPLSSLSAGGPCTYAPESGAAGTGMASPVTKQVTLNAGQTTELSLP